MSSMSVSREATASSRPAGRLWRFSAFRMINVQPRARARLTLLSQLTRSDVHRPSDLAASST
jgi:hypothetical protein